MADPENFFEALGTQIKAKQQESYNESRNYIDMLGANYRKRAEAIQSQISEEANAFIEELQQRQNEAEAYHKDFEELLETNVKSMLGADGENSSVENFTHMVQAINTQKEEFGGILEDEISAVKSNLKTLSEEIGLDFDPNDVFTAGK